MLLRLSVENFSSFKNAVEFNTFPSSKSKSHENHKIECGHAVSLRLAAIYGANGAGKSNLLQAIDVLTLLVQIESLSCISFKDDIFFAFDKNCSTNPSEIAVEFFHNGNVYYYHIAFNQQEIFSEELLLSKKTTDKEIFSRSDGKINIGRDFAGEGVNTIFIEAMTKLVRKDMLFLSFLAKYYPDAVPACTDAYRWFAEDVEFVHPDMRSWKIPHLLDVNKDFSDMVNRLMPQLGTGIGQLSVKKTILLDDDVKQDARLALVVKRAKDTPGEPQFLNIEDGKEIINIVYEDGQIYEKALCSKHQNINGEMVEIPLGSESDGTRRLIEYMPMLYDVLRRGRVYIVDEIERSMHPIMILDLISMLSRSETAKGQIIFTTHESNLLDQDIFRPDEIWLVQKDVEQATQLYPLSDYNIHKTANIEHGYLNGRYGGIPFLSNLKDLHW